MGSQRMSHGETLAEWLRAPRYEVLPLPGADQLVAEIVPKEVKVTVTASPRRGLDPTLDLAERLAGLGFRTVPHLAARLLSGGTHLEEVLERLRHAGIEEVFAIAGDTKEPAGSFAGSLEMLEAMEEIGHQLTDIGIAGYPESHPFIDDDITVQSMWDKRLFATYIVSNVCFDARAISEWVARVRRRGVELPIYVGLPGIADPAKLLRISQKIGIGESARFLKGHRSWLLRLVVPGAHSPTRLLRRMEPDLAAPDRGVLGLHVYTFNELARTERWRRRLLEEVTRA
jgi:methylenetetrahydrofolate reductase (NADPH)